MVKRIIVGAHYGFRDWLGQRVTAVVMALYTLFFAINALMLPEMTFDAWRVRGWPTIVVLDAQRRIHYRGHDGQAATEVAERLVAELQAEAGR